MSIAYGLWTDCKANTDWNLWSVIGKGNWIIEKANKNYSQCVEIVIFQIPVFATVLFIKNETTHYYPTNHNLNPYGQSHHQLMHLSFSLTKLY